MRTTAKQTSSNTGQRESLTYIRAYKHKRACKGDVMRDDRVLTGRDTTIQTNIEDSPTVTSICTYTMGVFRGFMGSNNPSELDFYCENLNCMKTRPNSMQPPKRKMMDMPLTYIIS